MLYYIVYRAALCSFTHDEAFTFQILSSQSWSEIASYNKATANNHLLNTLLAKLCANIFGNGEFSLRLPNVLAYILYAFFCARIALSVRHKLAVPAFLILLLNPYLLDFFSLCRGYALAISFMLGAIWFLTRFIEKGALRHSRLTLVFGFFMVLSNFSCLYLFLFLLGFTMVKNIKNKKLPDLVSMLIAAALAGVIYQPIKKLIADGELYYGGDSSFYTDTLGSLVQATSYYRTNLPTTIVNIVSVLLIFVFAVIGFLFFQTIFSKNKKQLFSNSVLWVVASLLPLIALVTTVNHYLSGTKFLFGRTAIFMIPLFLVTLVLLLNYLAEKRERQGTRLAWVLCIVVLVNAVFCCNQDYFLDWYYDQNTKQAMTELGKQYEKDQAIAPTDKKVALDINWLFEPTTNYYRQTMHYDWLKETNRSDDFTDSSNYIYAQASKIGLQKKQYEMIAVYRNTGTVLIKQKR